MVLCPTLLQAAEFFLFAALMVVMTIIFSIQAYFYQYINQNGSKGHVPLEPDTVGLHPEDIDMEITASSEEEDVSNHKQQKMGVSGDEMWNF